MTELKTSGSHGIENSHSQKKYQHGNSPDETVNCIIQDRYVVDQCLHGIPFLGIVLHIILRMNEIFMTTLLRIRAVCYTDSICLIHPDMCSVILRSAHKGGSSAERRTIQIHLSNYLFSGG